MIIEEERRKTQLGAAWEEFDLRVKNILQTEQFGLLENAINHLQRFDVPTMELLIRMLEIGAKRFTKNEDGSRDIVDKVGLGFAP